MVLKKDKMDLEILKPFGPSIVKAKIPEEIVSSLNNHIDDLAKNKEDISKLDYGSNLAGNVSQEFRLEINFMKKIKWAEFLSSVCQEWLMKSHNISIKKLYAVCAK